VAFTKTLAGGVDGELVDGEGCRRLSRPVGSRRLAKTEIGNSVGGGRISSTDLGTRTDGISRTHSTRVGDWGLLDDRRAGADSPRFLLGGGV